MQPLNLQSIAVWCNFLEIAWAPSGAFGSWSMAYKISHCVMNPFNYFSDCLVIHPGSIWSIRVPIVFVDPSGFNLVHPGSLGVGFFIPTDTTIQGLLPQCILLAELLIKHASVLCMLFQRARLQSCYRYLDLARLCTRWFTLISAEVDGAILPPDKSKSSQTPIVFSTGNIAHLSLPIIASTQMQHS